MSQSTLWIPESQDRLVRALQASHPLSSLASRGAPYQVPPGRPASTETVCGSISRAVFSPEINNSHLRFYSFTCPLVVIVSLFIKVPQWLPSGFGIRSNSSALRTKALSDLAPSSPSGPSLPLLLLGSSTLWHPTVQPVPSAFQFLKQALQMLQWNGGSMPRPLAAQASSSRLPASALSASQLRHHFPPRMPAFISQILMHAGPSCPTYLAHSCVIVHSTLCRHFLFPQRWPFQGCHLP